VSAGEEVDLPETFSFVTTESTCSLTICQTLRVPEMSTEILEYS
jgi:hypothetical protein